MATTKFLAKNKIIFKQNLDSIHGKYKITIDLKGSFLLLYF